MEPLIQEAVRNLEGFKPVISEMDCLKYKVLGYIPKEEFLPLLRAEMHSAKSVVSPLIKVVRSKYGKPDFDSILTEIVLATDYSIALSWLWHRVMHECEKEVKQVIYINSDVSEWIKRNDDSIRVRQVIMDAEIFKEFFKEVE